MVKSPDQPRQPGKPRNMVKRDPAKHSKKDPAKPTRAKAARPDLPPTDPALADLLNPGIGQGTAGPGSQTGLEPPPDNSFDRRADFSAAHRARKSTAQGFSETPQSGYAGKGAAPLGAAPLGVDAELAQALGFEGDEGSEAASTDKNSVATFRGVTGAAATVNALERLLREGRPEFSERPWTPHRPPRPEKSEGGRRLVIRSDFDPKGDQPQAIADLVEGVKRHDRTQVLLGVTGSGKTFTMAKVIEETQRPALVLAPNKTLAAQLYGEFRAFFPDNAVEYFVSYYDYYQPEAYVPRTDTYIEKESSINEQIDRMRHSATRSLLERDDVIIVASVSCIYGIGSVETYSAMTFTIKQGERLDQRALIADLVALQYKRSAGDFFRGAFRVRGDVIEIFPAHYEDRAWRVSLFGDEVESIHEFDPLTGQKTDELEFVKIYANSHYVTPRPTLLQAIAGIKQELRWRLDQLNTAGRLLGGAAARAAHALRPRNDGGDRQLRRHRELFALPHRPQGRRAAAHVVRIRARQRARVRGREPRHHPAARRHVPRRLPEEGDLGRVRLPAAVLHGQPAAALRGMGRDAAADRLRLGHARRLGDRAGGGRLRRAGDPPDRADRSAGRRAAGAHPGRRSGRRGAAGGAGRLPLAGHGADQAHGRGSHRIPARAGNSCQVHAFRHRHAGADRDHPRPAARRLRRAGRHQPVARGARHSGMRAGRHPRCRQGGLLALGDQPGPDHRPRRPQHRRPRDPLCRHRDRLDGARYRRDQSTSRKTNGVQHRERHHARERAQGHRRYPGVGLRARPRADLDRRSAIRASSRRPPPSATISRR